VQFLVYVSDVPKCGLTPVIIPPRICLDVQVGTPVNFNISAMTSCDYSVSNISLITVSGSVVGMNVSSTIGSLTNTSVSYIIISWIPQANQIGSQRVCTIAYSE
jgi:hypothetical protein